MQLAQARAVSVGAGSSLPGKDKNKNRANTEGWSQAHLQPSQLLCVPSPALRPDKLICFRAGKAENATP